MKEDNSINKIIKKLCREIFPEDVFQQGNSRVYLDDNGYYFTMAEFQPYSLKKGIFLNAGISFLFTKDDFLSFAYSYHCEPRIGKKLIEYADDGQFEKDAGKYVMLANEHILKYREFTDIAHAKKHIVNETDDTNWNPYIKSMFYFLTDDLDNGRKYYQMFLNDPFFKEIISEYGYPTDILAMDKEQVLAMIRDQRKFWHSKPMMKKMKRSEEYER